MNINKTINLVLKDVYSYDISSCHYNILKQLGFDVSDIDKDNKEKRNITIGKMMKENPRITFVLRETTNNIIMEYLNINNIKDEEIVTIQYDGFISIKPLKELNLYIPLELRTIYNKLIISSDRNKFIALDHKDKLDVKGVAHRYDEMDNIYKKILDINFISKKMIFERLQKIKNEIVSGENIKLYGIPIDDENYNVIFKGYGIIPISQSVISMLDLDDIEKEKYFDIYIRPFTESICFEYL